MTLTTARLDRACGVLLGTAAGDALGAAYEFGPPRGPDFEVAMVGGGSFGWEPGEWTDDTSMAIAIAEVAATGADLRQEQALDVLAQRWYEWSLRAKDVGVQTRSVLSQAGRHGISAQTARNESAALHQGTGRTAGNGSLMRTAPVALAYLDDEAALVEAARAVSELTHYDPEAGDACVLWCCAIRHGILTGALDARIGLQHIDIDRREMWASRLDTAEASQPSDFANNGWVVEALQAAWSAIRTTPVAQDDPATGRFRVDHLRLALDAAVRGGNDTDTVAAIAGGLLGAAYGASAVPAEWRRVLHGWPALATRDLVALATRIVKADTPFSYDVDPLIPVRHPHDDGVWLGDIATLRALPPGVDAVVSLCRVDDRDLPVGVEQIDIRLIDIVDPDANPNLDFVLTDTVRLIEQLRNEGRTVLVHCVAAQSRTPTVAALYGARKQVVSGNTALRDVTSALPNAYPNNNFRLPDINTSTPADQHIHTSLRPPNPYPAVEPGGITRVNDAVRRAQSKQFAVPNAIPGSVFTPDSQHQENPSSPEPTRHHSHAIAAATGHAGLYCYQDRPPRTRWPAFAHEPPRKRRAPLRR